MGKRTTLVVAICPFLLLVLAGAYLIMDVIYLYWRSAAEPQYDAHWWAELKHVFLSLSLVGIAWISDSIWLLRRLRSAAAKP